MTTPDCAALHEPIEPLAAGEALSPEAQAHLQGCASCRARLALAMRVERVLREWPVPPPAPAFSQKVIEAVRRETWRREQVLDRSFNAAIGIGVAAVVVGVLSLAWVLASAAGGGDSARLLGEMAGTLLARLRPQLAVTATASLLVTTALGAWWWAEGRMRL